MGASGGFFLDAAATGVLSQGAPHAGLFLLSIVVAVFAATMALQTIQVARRMETPVARRVVLCIGAVALACGIWSSHFIGLQGYQLPAPASLAGGLTLASMLAAAVAAAVMLHVIGETDPVRFRLLLGAVFVGASYCAMQALGLAALETPLPLRYEPAGFALSVLAAFGLALLCLWIRYGLRKTALSGTQRYLASGAVMGLALAGMHYAGMAGVRFVGETASWSRPGVELDGIVASCVLGAFALLVTALTAAMAGLTRARETNRKMEESRLRLRATLDTAVDGIITIDSRGVIQGFNHSAERLFGWKADEVIGRNIKMLMPEPDQSRHDGYLRNYVGTGVPKIIGVGREVTGLRKDGSLMPMRLGVGRVDLPGELLFVGFVTDISERHALEASLRETAERAERAAAAKGTFLANMSHEIRTPMNSIIGFTELLLQGDLTASQRRHLNTIRQSSRSLLGLINDILDTTRMEKGRLELEVIDFSLRGLAFQIESSLRLAAQAKQLTLKTNYPAEMPEHFHGDPLRVLQVLTNLVGNAIKFTERGGVEVDFSRQDDKVHVQVRDTGIGMTTNQVASIFTAFTQADASISRRFGGTGLGTTIARQLVELMGGSIEVESQVGQGSTFHIWLPLPLGRPPAAAPLVAPRLALPPMRILIADDVKQNLELLALTLEGAGHQLEMAGDGGEAVEKFMAGSFDLVLMDVHMPGTDGIEATRLIRQQERQRASAPTPIIALTASVMEDDRKAARQAGMDGFAAKPLDVPRLFEEIARVLGLQGDTPLRPGQEMSSIDWESVVALWGSEARLAAAVDKFLSTVVQDYPLPDEAASDVDWARTRFSLHGLRGATGNLALPAIARFAGVLEEMVAAGRHEEARPKIATLRRMLTEAKRDFDATGRPGRDTLPAAPSAPDTTVPLTDLLRAMRALMVVLERNELDDGALDEVCGGLESRGERTSAQTLRTAVDTFEFKQARSKLQQLLDLHGKRA